MVFSELCLTGYTCQDLFLQDTLLSAAEDALRQIVAASDGIDALIFVGLPYEKDGKLYNVAAAINCGELMGFVPKRNIPMYGEFYEGRHFTPGNRLPVIVEFDRTGSTVWNRYFIYGGCDSGSLCGGRAL